MIFGSVCSGIEAASVAWKGLGWKAAFFSEVENFPCQLLHHHYGCGRAVHMPSPDDEGLSHDDRQSRKSAIKANLKIPEQQSDIVNFGDMTKFKEWPNVSIDLLCGGTPCQSFSVAGLRKGLDDSRGNLMLAFGEIAARYRPRWLVWENVPGVLSSNAGKDFATFLGLVSGQTVAVPKEGWGSFGIIPGYKNAYGLAYRVFDAQYFGVAQRRRRVFVIGYLGDWRPAAAVLFERESLRGNPAPRRQAGQRLAPCVTSGPPFSRTGNDRVEADAMVVAGKNHWDGGPHPSLSQSHNTGGIGQSNQELFSQGGAGLVPALNPEVFPTLDASMDKKFGCNQWVDGGQYVYDVASTLRGEGFDASEDGTGRQNLVPTYGIPGNWIGREPQNGGNAVEPMHDVSPCLNTTDRHGVATPICWDEEINAQEDLSGALVRGGDGGRHAGVAVPMAFQSKASPCNSMNPSVISPTLDVGKADGVAVVGAFKGGQGAKAGGIGYENEMAPTLTASDSGTQQSPSVLINMAVRRLTPVECERLQGFPDNYTKISAKTADGPRYKGLGNSWAVPNVEWIGRRIDMVDKILRGEL